MSSFIGHGLAALTIGRALGSATEKKKHLFWQLWLVLSAVAPDIDYLVLKLNSANNDGVRITHSIAFALMLTVFGLFHQFLFDPKNIVRGGIQCFLASSSHLFLDTLVGSRAGDPWFYPFSTETYRIPLGILPSSPKFELTNYYLYRNLLIELGIMIPVCVFILYFTGKFKPRKIWLAGLVPVFLFFLIWSIGLNR